MNSEDLFIINLMEGKPKNEKNNKYIFDNMLDCYSVKCLCHRFNGLGIFY